MPYFGHRVIGKEAAAREAAAEAIGANYFGPRVTSKSAAAPPRRTESGAVARPANAATAQRRPAEGLSVEEIERSLEQNPLLAEPFYEQELARPGGARLAALVLLRDAFPVDAGERSEIEDLIASKQVPEPETPATPEVPVPSAPEPDEEPETPGQKRNRERREKAAAAKGGK